MPQAMLLPGVLPATASEMKPGSGLGRCRLQYLLVLSVYIAMCAGCASSERSVVHLETPRVNVHTRLSPYELVNAMVVDGCSVVQGDTGRAPEVVVVKGTGSLHWPAAEITVKENSVVANGVEVASRPDGYRNLVIETNGRVVPDAVLPFERHFP